MFNARPLFRALTTNLNASAFTAKNITATKPSGNGVLTLGNPAGGGMVPGKVVVYPILLGSDGDVYSMRLIAWHRMGAGPGTNWFPRIIGEFVCTASTFVGIAGGYVAATERLADTIALAATGQGEATVTADVTRTGTCEVFSPANNTPAWVELWTRGAELLEFDFDQTTGTPTGNALVQFLDDDEE